MMGTSTDKVTVLKPVTPRKRNPEWDLDRKIVNDAFTRSKKDGLEAMEVHGRRYCESIYRSRIENLVEFDAVFCIVLDEVERRAVNNPTTIRDWFAFAGTVMHRRSIDHFRCLRRCSVDTEQMRAEFRARQPQNPSNVSASEEQFNLRELVRWVAGQHKGTKSKIIACFYSAIIDGEDAPSFRELSRRFGVSRDEAAAAVAQGGRLLREFA